jgi:hypothetical protein
MVAKHYLLFFVFSLLGITSSYAQDWGQIMKADQVLNIRKARSTRSRVVGKLYPGQPVKADFLEKNWYAVFDPKATFRDPKTAIGYVYAPLLQPVKPVSVSHTKPEGYKILEKWRVDNREADVGSIKVVLYVQNLPDERGLKDSVYSVWRKERGAWEAVSIYVYFPDMDTADPSYAVCTFDKNGLQDFWTRRSVLYGTKWFY